jgi:hypothetical protein
MLSVLHTIGLGWFNPILGPFASLAFSKLIITLLNTYTLALKLAMIFQKEPPPLVMRRTHPVAL